MRFAGCGATRVSYNACCYAHGKFDACIRWKSRGIRRLHLTNQIKWHITVGNMAPSEEVNEQAAADREASKTEAADTRGGAPGVKVSSGNAEGARMDASNASVPPASTQEASGANNARGPPDASARKSQRARENQGGFPVLYPSHLPVFLALVLSLTLLFRPSPCPVCSSSLLVGAERET